MAGKRVATGMLASGRKSRPQRQQENNNVPEVRKDAFTVTSGANAWTFTPAGLVSATLAGRPVLTGGTAPVSSDCLFDANDGTDKVGPLIGSALSVTGKVRCVVGQSFARCSIRQEWSVAEDVATCEFQLTNRGPAPIRFPALGSLTASWPITPNGIATGAWYNEPYLQYCGRSILTPSYWLRIRASYLAGGGVGVGVCPLDLGDEKNLVLWEATGDNLAYTSRWFRLIWDRPISPGESRTMRFALKVAATEDYKELLEPYKGAMK
jgi:hypothetical protein